MTTIVLSDDTFEFISNLVSELDTQDGRGTREPYVYAIRDVERVYGIDDSEFDSSGWSWTDGEKYFDTDDELIQYALDNEEPIDFNFHEPTIDEVADILGFNAVAYKEMREIKNFFFSQKEADNHIEQNSHHFDDPDVRVIHLFRNEEVQTVLDSLIEIVEGEVEDDES